MNSHHNLYSATFNVLFFEFSFVVLRVLHFLAVLIGVQQSGHLFHVPVHVIVFLINLFAQHQNFLFQFLCIVLQL